MQAAASSPGAGIIMALIRQRAPASASNRRNINRIAAWKSSTLVSSAPADPWRERRPARRAGHLALPRIAQCAVSSASAFTTPPYYRQSLSVPNPEIRMLARYYRPIRNQRETSPTKLRRFHVGGELHYFLPTSASVGERIYAGVRLYIFIFQRFASRR